MNDFANGWADALKRDSTPEGISAVIGAVNKVVENGTVNRASVIVAFSLMMSQIIVEAGKENVNIAPQIRQAIADLIDSFALQKVMMEET